MNALSFLHVFNDGFHASFLLLLPFIAAELGINLTQVGILSTIVGVSGMVLALPAGFISTKIGGLKTLVFALFIYALAYLGVGLSHSYFFLLPVFMLAGIGFGVFHPIAFALVAKWSTKEKRGQMMGNFTAIGDIGRIGISTALTFLIGYWGWRTTSELYAVMAILLAAICYAMFLRNQNDKVAGKEQQKAESSLWQIVKNRRFIFASGTTFFDCFASTSLYVFLPFLLLKRGVDPTLLGSFAAAFFIGNFLGKTVLGRLIDKVGSLRVFLASELSMAIFIFLLANSTSFFVIIFCSIILGAFTKGTVPVLQTMVVESIEHEAHLDKAFGINALTASVAGTIAPLLLGFAADKIGIVSAFNLMAIAALLAIIPASLFHISRPKMSIAI